jgi:hypothetical protein
MSGADMNTGILRANPTEFCFFCDPLAPCDVVAERSGCDACKQQMKRGIVLVSKSQEGPGAHRTGWRTMVSEKWLMENIDPCAARDQIKRDHFAFVSDAAWTMLKLRRSKKILYCVVMEYYHRDTDTYTVDHVYCHANDQFEAKTEAVRGEGAKSIYRIVEAAPVIGFYMEDRDGLKLSTS